MIARSIVRDLHSGVALARFFATLMLATGVGPVFAPQIGSWILAVTDWRGVFWVLALFGTLLLVSAWWRVPETLPPAARLTGSVWSSLGTMTRVARDRVFLGYVLAGGLGMGGTFAYIAGSSFVLQDVYGLSALAYGLVFALCAFGMVIGAQVSGRLTGRLGAARLLTSGLVTMIAGGAVLFAAVSTRIGGLPAVIAALWAFMFGFGFVGPSAAALAMQRYPQAAGSAAAVLGSFQFGVAAIIAPLAGTGGTADATPMITLILVLPIAAVVCQVLLAAPGRPGRAPGFPRGTDRDWPRCAERGSVRERGRRGVIAGAVTPPPIAEVCAAAAAGDSRMRRSLNGRSRASGPSDGGQQRVVVPRLALPVPPASGCLPQAGQSARRSPQPVSRQPRPGRSNTGAVLIHNRAGRAVAEI